MNLQQQAILTRLLLLKTVFKIEDKDLTFLNEGMNCTTFVFSGKSNDTFPKGDVFAEVKSKQKDRFTLGELRTHIESLDNVLGDSDLKVANRLNEYCKLKPKKLKEFFKDVSRLYVNDSFEVSNCVEAIEEVEALVKKSMVLKVNVDPQTYLNALYTTI